MKKLTQPFLWGLAASLAAISAGPVRADPPAQPVAAVLQGVLTWIDIDPQLEGFQDIDSGNITINLTAREVVLTLHHARPPLNAPSLEEIRLPLLSVDRGRCNTTYVARRDLRPVDGPFRAIEVIDYEHTGPGSSPPPEPCPQPFEPVSISYDTISSGFGAPVEETHSSFRASRLVRPLERAP